MNVNFYHIKREIKRVKSLLIKIEKLNFNKQKFNRLHVKNKMN